MDDIEISPSARATCKGCNKKIEKGILRFAFTDDFMQQQYYHLECAAKKHGDRLKKVLEEYQGNIPDKNKLMKIISDKPASPAGYPYAELAKTGRSKCIKCGNVIEKGAIRVAVEREFDSPTGGKMSGAGYLHVECANGYQDISFDNILKNSVGLDEISKKKINSAMK
jgi:hypothetical protein